MLSPLANAHPSQSCLQQRLQEVMSGVYPLQTKTSAFILILSYCSEWYLLDITRILWSCWRNRALPSKYCFIGGFSSKFLVPMFWCKHNSMYVNDYSGEQSVRDYFNLCPCHALWYLPESSCLRISHSFPRAGRPVHGVELWVSGVLEAPAQLDAIFFSSHLAALFLASGLSFIQYFEINSPRNLVVLGVSIFFGFQTTDIVSNKMDELTSK